MTNEVIAIDPFASIDVLWRRKWTLVGATLLAAFIAFGIARALPKTWESQAVVRVGQVGRTPVENPAETVRHLNVGTLKCGDRSSAGSERLDGVNAAVEFGSDSKEIRLIARGRTSDEARARASAAIACLVSRHQQPFELAIRRDADFLEALEVQYNQLKENIAHVTGLVERVTSISSSTGETLLLLSRLGDDRVRLLELANRIQSIRLEHAGDTPTSALNDPSSPASPIWPRPGLLAAVSGAVGLLLTCVWILYASTRSPASRAR